MQEDVCIEFLYRLRGCYAGNHAVFLYLYHKVVLEGAERIHLMSGTIEVQVQEVIFVEPLYREKGCWANTSADITSYKEKEVQVVQLMELLYRTIGCYTSVVAGVFSALAYGSVTECLTSSQNSQSNHKLLFS